MARRREAQGTISLTVMLAVIIVTLRPGFADPSGAHASAVTAKRHCHSVTKKVHGKKKRVKVCAKAKPKPVATPTETPTATASPTPTPWPVGWSTGPDQPSVLDGHVFGSAQLPDGRVVITDGHYLPVFNPQTNTSKSRLGLIAL